MEKVIMNIRMLAAACAAALILCACGSAPMPPPSEIEDSPDYETYTFNDITVSVPANWTRTAAGGRPGQHRSEFRDHDIEAKLWGTYQLEIFTELSVLVIDRETQGILGRTPQEHINDRYDGLSAEGKEKELLMIDGLEAGRVSHKRPYFNFRLTEIFILNNGREYYISAHYNYADEEIVAIVNDFFGSITISP
jgi:hypothetical protein